MIPKTALTLSIATALAISPALGMGQNSINPQGNQNNLAAAPGSHEVMQMVEARTGLDKTIDAKAPAGSPVSATLRNAVTLKNGTEIPAGSTIKGVVAQDDMNLNGTSKLALTFNQAELKNGSVVPVKATIMAIYPPESTDTQGRPIAPGNQVIGVWNGESTGVDQEDAVGSADLHSKIVSNDSGVLVSSKQDVKLKAGSEIGLAIAPASDQQAGGQQ